MQPFFRNHILLNVLEKFKIRGGGGKWSLYKARRQTELQCLSKGIWSSHAVDRREKGNGNKALLVERAPLWTLR